MEIHSFQDIEIALAKTREEVYKTTVPIRSLLDTAVSLFLEAADLMKSVAKDTDDERYALEVLAAALRRVIASIVLLESGLHQEAHMVLRNPLELMLIAIDITYCEDSLEEWKKTIGDELKDINHDEWFFKTSKVYTRISDNERNFYPKLEKTLATNIYQEWKFISNKSLHAHSQAQIRTLFNSRGNFQLLGRKTLEKYEKDFRMYQGIIFDISTLLCGIIRRPRYRDLINKNKALLAKANRFAENYSKLRGELSITGRILEENTMKVSFVDSKGKDIGVSRELGKALAELGVESEAVAKAGGDFGYVIRKMLQLLEANGFEVTKLKATVTYADAVSGMQIENITLHYVD